MIERKDVTIIIPHFGGTQEAEYAFNQCILSLNETEPSIERITIKNGNKCFEHQTSLCVQKQGQCKAVNAAVAITTTPWIFVTNDDMIYPPGWFEKLVVDHNISMPSIDIEYIDNLMCISPRLVEPRSGAPTFINEFCGGAGGDFDKQKFLDFSSQYAGEGLKTGFNLPFLISRELWDTIGGYDVQYDPWSSNSDSDLEYKIKLAGIQPYQNNNCVVYHFSQTSGTFEPRNQIYWQNNWDYFIKKWGFPRTDSGIWEASFEIPKENIYHPTWEGKYGSA